MDGNDESSQYTESGAVIDTMTMAPIAKPPSIFLIHLLSKVPLLELTISTLGSHDFCVAMVTRSSHVRRSITVPFRPLAEFSHGSQAALK
jgi:hypothetical protein